MLFILCVFISLTGCSGKKDNVEKKTSNVEKYKTAMDFFESSAYDKARQKFTELNDYKDSKDYVQMCSLKIALQLMDKEQYDEAEKELNTVNICDTDVYLKECEYRNAEKIYKSDKESAVAVFEKLGEYRDSVSYLADYGNTLCKNGKYKAAVKMLKAYQGNKKAAKVIDKAKMRIKYAKVTSDIGVVNWGDHDIISDVKEIEDTLKHCYYDDYIKYDNQKKKMKMDKYTIGGRMYGVTALALLDGGADSVLIYYYLDKPDTKYALAFHIPEYMSEAIDSNVKCLYYHNGFSEIVNGKKGDDETYYNVTADVVDSNMDEAVEKYKEMKKELEIEQKQEEQEKSQDEEIKNKIYDDAKSEFSCRFFTGLDPSQWFEYSGDKTYQDVSSIDYVYKSESDTYIISFYVDVDRLQGNLFSKETVRYYADAEYSYEDGKVCCDDFKIVNS